MDIREYSEQRIGRTWDQVDHLMLIMALDKIDQLAQDLANARERREVLA